jgi:hypothetical protein
MHTPRLKGKITFRPGATSIRKSIAIPIAISNPMKPIYSRKTLKKT